MSLFNYNSSWYNSYTFIFVIQKRIFKSTYVSNFRMIFLLQKLLLQSNSARLLSIRDVTQLSSIRKISGTDNKISLTFSERFQLNEYLRENLNNWFPSSLKKISILDKDGKPKLCRIPTIADRVWLELVKKSIEPVHEAIFNPRNFGFRFNRSFYEVQNSVFLNLSMSSYGWQKRFLKVSLPENLFVFDTSFVLSRLLVPRSIKLGILRYLKNGLHLSFCATCFVFKSSKDLKLLVSF